MTTHVTVSNSPPPPASRQALLDDAPRQEMALMDRLTGQAPKTCVATLKKTQSLMSLFFSMLGACLSCKCCRTSESEWLTREIKRDSTWGQPIQTSPPPVPDPDPL